MKKIFFLFISLFIYSLTFITSCNKDNPVNSEDPNPPTENKILIDTTINASTLDPIVNIAGKISVTIPKEIIPTGTKLKITQLDISKLPSQDSNKFHYAYEVELSIGNKFSKPLNISINYDPTKRPTGIFRNSISAAFYNDSLKGWYRFSSCTIDTINNKINFTTDHLTKLAVYHLAYLEGYTDYYESAHFTVYYELKDLPSNSAYAPFPTHYNGKDPNYIVDIGYFLDESWSAFKLNNLDVHNGRLNVFVKDLGEGIDGESDKFGRYICISNIKNNPKIADVTKLQQACAHEYFHYVQDYYYAMIVQGLLNRWWIEASASNADRLVWQKPSNIKFYQTEDPDYTNLDNNFSKSWDDCNTDPEWYKAGSFISYMMENSCFNLAMALKDAGNNFSIAQVRDVIDNQLKTDCPSSGGITGMYKNFATKVFQRSIDSVTYQNNSTIWGVTDIKTSGSSLVLSHYTFNSLSEVNNFERPLPYLSSWIHHIYNKVPEKVDTFAQTFILYADYLPQDAFAYLYVKKRYSNNTIQTVGIGGCWKNNDSVVFDINDQKGTLKDIHAEILIVNGSKNISIPVDNVKLRIKPIVTDKMFKTVNLNLQTIPWSLNNTFKITATIKLLNPNIKYDSVNQNSYGHTTDVTFYFTHPVPCNPPCDKWAHNVQAFAPTVREGKYQISQNLFYIDTFIGFKSATNTFIDTISVTLQSPPGPLSFTYRWQRKEVNASGQQIGVIEYYDHYVKLYTYP